MVKLSIFLSLINLISCSTVSIISNQKSSLTFDQKEGQRKEVSYNVTKKFYMWGLVPKKHVIALDDKFSEQGFNEVSDIAINETMASDKLMWMVLTLGMYYPVTYNISGKVN